MRWRHSRCSGINDVIDTWSGQREDSAWYIPITTTLLVVGVTWSPEPEMTSLRLYVLQRPPSGAIVSYIPSGSGTECTVGLYSTNPRMMKSTWMSSKWRLIMVSLPDRMRWVLECHQKADEVGTNTPKKLLWSDFVLICNGDVVKPVESKKSSLAVHMERFQFPFLGFKRHPGFTDVQKKRDNRVHDIVES